LTRQIHSLLAIDAESRYDILSLTDISSSAEDEPGFAAIFDGKTLNGWIQAPPAPIAFSNGDLVDLPALAKRLSHEADPVSTFLYGQLDDAAKVALANPSDNATSNTLSSILVKNLNRIVNGPSLYEEERFHDVALRLETTAFRQKNPQGLDLARLNRLLLEDVYSHELAKSPSTSWVVKDGAMASTGGGRGVIYTKSDYTHYRLIFKLRHVSGKPDHQPCVLVFCTRPAEGEKGLDALGGIQFQAPNGGHWDYRPGHNNGGTGFTNPIKPKYDNHEWSHVEILVNAKDGSARMAVAQPVGTRGVEALDFKDPAAGKPGPIAWQMHNAGLFDEFKDIRIEVDPQDDRLITTL